MNYNQIENILSKLLDKEHNLYDVPTEAEWNDLSKILNVNFTQEFKYFISLMSFWSFPGDIFNVSNGKTNGNDSIAFVYKFELDNNENWDPNMIPFYGIGNGDYFCINYNNSVYFYDHEQNAFEKYFDTFELWIKDLPTFLE